MYTIEAMMGDRKFTDENGQSQHVWQTSWAISTHFILGIIMTDGDDTGLMLPPKLAPIQVVIVPIWKKANKRTGVLNATTSVKQLLQNAGIRVYKFVFFVAGLQFNNNVRWRRT